MDRNRLQHAVGGRILAGCDLRLYAGELCLEAMGRRAHRQMRQQQLISFFPRRYQHTPRFRRFIIADNADLEVASGHEEEDWCPAHV